MHREEKVEEATLWMDGSDETLGGFAHRNMQRLQEEGAEYSVKAT